MLALYSFQKRGIIRLSRIGRFLEFYPAVFIRPYLSSWGDPQAEISSLGQGSPIEFWCFRAYHKLRAAQENSDIEALQHQFRGQGSPEIQVNAKRLLPKKLFRRQFLLEISAWILFEGRKPSSGQFLIETEETI